MAKDSQDGGLTGGTILLIVSVVLIWKFYDYNIIESVDKNTQSENLYSNNIQKEIESSVNFQIKYQDRIEKDFLGNYVTERYYTLLNAGEHSENIKWAAINNRDDCLAVPVWSSYERTIQALEVLSDGDSAEVADFLSLEVGQAVPLKMPTTCGEPIRLKVGTDKGEYDIGPFTFF